MGSNPAHFSLRLVGILATAVYETGSGISGGGRGEGEGEKEAVRCCVRVSWSTFLLHEAVPSCGASRALMFLFLPPSALGNPTREGGGGSSSAFQDGFREGREGGDGVAFRGISVSLPLHILYMNGMRLCIFCCRGS